MKTNLEETKRERTRKVTHRKKAGHRRMKEFNIWT